VLILAGLAAVLLLVPLLGGRLSRLAELPLRSRWVVAYALALQVLAVSVAPGWPHPVLLGLHVSSYVLAAVFVWLNRGVAGVPLLTLGAGLNALAIAANGGQMPASPSALAAAGLAADPSGFSNSVVVESPRLALLGDVFATPGWLPFQNVCSVGDLLVLAGGAWLLVSASGASGRRLDVLPRQVGQPADWRDLADR